MAVQLTFGNYSWSTLLRQASRYEAWVLPLLLGNALVLLLLLARLVLSRWRVGKTTFDAASRKLQPPAGHSLIFSLVPPGARSVSLRAEDSDLPAFEDFASRIYEVSHGIFYGEEGGDRLPSWPRGDFTAALRDLRLRAEAIGWPFGGQLHDPLDDVALASRLISAGLNVSEAVDRLKDYRKYRAGIGGGVAPTLDWLDCGIAIVPCEDRLGRPIINIRPRYHRPGNPALFRLGLRCTLDAVKAHFLHKRQHTFSDTNPLEQYAMVWDFQGATTSNLDWEAFNITLDEGHLRYPNMGSQIYVLNARASVRFIWYAARRLLHPRIRRKCLLLAPQDVPALMRRLVSPEKLPPDYGGTGRPWPGPQDAVCFEDQVGELAASAFARAGVVPAGALPLRAELSSERLTYLPDNGDNNSQHEHTGGLLSCCGRLHMRSCL